MPNKDDDVNRNKRRRFGGKRYLAETRPKSFTLPFEVVFAFRNLAPEYGSQGRSIQVGTELLLRIGRRLPVPAVDPKTQIRWTYKLPPRTIQIIRQLASRVYKSEAEVLIACVAILGMDKVPAFQPKRRKRSIAAEDYASQSNHSLGQEKNADSLDPSPPGK